MPNFSTSELKILDRRLNYYWAREQFILFMVTTKKIVSSYIASLSAIWRHGYASRLGI